VASASSLARQGIVVSIDHPSRRIAWMLRPCRLSRCMPVTASWSWSAGWAWMARSVDRIKPNSARVPVT
jgi:hypothetical protein